MPQMIKKRSGAYQKWDGKKITKAILAAFNDVDPHNIPDVNPMVRGVEEKFGDIKSVDIEKVQDAVELALMEADHHQAAKAYILYRRNRDSIRQKRMMPDNMAMAKYIHVSKYARWLPREKRRENWDEIVDRVMEMHRKKVDEMIDFDVPGVEDLLVKSTRLIKEMKILPSMRSMQFGGEPCFKHNARMFNCLGKETAFVTHEGVRTFEDCEDGERVTVMTPGGKWAHATVRSYGRQQLYKVLFARGRSKVAVRATSNHRWPLYRDGSGRDWTDALEVGDRIPTAPEHSSYIEGDDRDWAEGFFFGDGTVNRRSSGSYRVVRLCGDKAKLLPHFLELGYTFSKPPSYPGDDVIVYMGKGEKVLPDMPSRAFIEGYLEADGAKRKGGGYHSIQATGSETIAWIRRHFPACGYYILSEQTPPMVTNFGKRSAETVRFTLMHHSEDHAYAAWTVNDFIEDREEQVWCLEVDGPEKAFVLATGVSTGNCTFTLVDRPRVFQEIFYLLLCGAGVGFSVQFHHVSKLPEIKQTQREVKHFHIPDKIEGWADAIGELIQSHLNGTEWVEMDYSAIRPEGAPISSGGKAPGHLPLRHAIETIREILRKAIGRNLRPIECHDIICHLADAVLAGGVRRSSLISIFSADDGEMMRAKTPENFRPARGTDPGLNNQRQLSNNSPAFYRDLVTREQFMRLVKLAGQNYGEPGFVFMQSFDKSRNYGCNPCGEVGLNPTITAEQFQEVMGGPRGSELYLETIGFDLETGEGTGFGFCNLCEINLARIKSEEEFLEACEAAAFIGTIQASYNSFPYLGPISEAVQRREALLGVSLTGMADNPTLAFNYDLLKKGATTCVDANRVWAHYSGIRTAARVTCIKPSGTASVAVGVVGSGIHQHHARRYFRRITANVVEAPARYFAESNPHMIEEKPNGDIAIVFPIQAPEGAITIKEDDAIQFIDRVFGVYESWVKPGLSRPGSSPGLNHNVSCTATFRQDEYAEVIKRVWDNKHRITAMTFAPDTIDKKFPFAPREAVDGPEDEARWNHLISNYKPVDWSRLVEEEDNTSPQGEVACSGPDGCEIT